MTRAAVYDEIGGPEVLRVAEVTPPSPGPREVLIRVHAAGINPYDSKVRAGFIPSSAPFPRRIGADLAGTVEQLGQDATYWDGTPVSVGDEVLGRGAGSVAEYALATAANLARRPEGTPVEVAGGLNVPGLTALSCLRTVSVGPEDVVLVGGATGAVGLIVCQLVRHTGARVIATASPRNFDFVRELGAEPIEYGEGLAERVAGALADGEAITAVMDCHGREALDAGVALGVPKDRIVGIAGYAAIDELGVVNVERKARTAENLAGLAQLVAGGKLTVPVVGAYPLDDVVAAFAALDAPHAPGKIVVTP